MLFRAKLVLNWFDRKNLILVTSTTYQFVVLVVNMRIVVIAGIPFIEKLGIANYNSWVVTQVILVQLLDLW